MKGRGRRGLKRYQSALKAIRSKHKAATHRDAQAIYRKLARLTGGPVNARQVATARKSTTAKFLKQARRAGSRTSPRTKAQKQKQARLARKFEEKRAKQRIPHGATKTRKARKPKAKSPGRKKSIIGGGGRTPREAVDEPTRREAFDGTAFDDGEEISAAEWDRRFNEADADDIIDDDIEIESSADYGATP